MANTTTRGTAGSPVVRETTTAYSSASGKPLGRAYVVRNKTGKEFMDEYLLNNGKWVASCMLTDELHGWYESKEAAEFALLLATSPREALMPFLTATGGVYEAEEKTLCHECAVVKRKLEYGSRLGGTLEDQPCMDCGKGRLLSFYKLPTPNPAVFPIAADWFEEREEYMKAEVLRSLISKGE